MGVTKAVILTSLLAAFMVSVTTSYDFGVPVVEPSVVTSSISLRAAFNCSVFFRHCVMNVFCDPVSIRMRAWHLVVGPLAVTSAHTKTKYKQCQNMTKQCFINENYIYNPIEKQRVSAFMVIPGYLSIFHLIFV